LAFQRETDVTKDTIQDFEIVFFVPGPANADGVQSGRLEVQIQISSSEIFTRNYDLLLRLNDDAAGLVHLAALADLRDYIIARLNAEVLPL
jgi:hypothetical protein